MKQGKKSVSRFSKFFAGALALALALSFALSGVALASEVAEPGEPGSAVTGDRAAPLGDVAACNCTAACAAANAETGAGATSNPACPVCGAENADLTQCAGSPEPLLTLAHTGTMVPMGNIIVVDGAPTDWIARGCKMLLTLHNRAISSNWATRWI